MQGRYFYNADGELLIVPQLGRLRLLTEMGVVEIEPPMMKWSCLLVRSDR